jgi:hypothetical protein
MIRDTDTVDKRLTPLRSRRFVSPTSLKNVSQPVEASLFHTQNGRNKLRTQGSDASSTK